MQGAARSWLLLPRGGAGRVALQAYTVLDTSEFDAQATTYELNTERTKRCCQS